MDERGHIPHLTDADIDRIAVAVAEKAKESFHIGEEKHYNDHQRLDRLLDAYEGAKNKVWQAFLGLVIVGLLIVAGIGASKGVR